MIDFNKSLVTLLNQGEFPDYLYVQSKEDLDWRLRNDLNNWLWDRLWDMFISEIQRTTRAEVKWLDRLYI
jgi:hypothetical protein